MNDITIRTAEGMVSISYEMDGVEHSISLDLDGALHLALIIESQVSQYRMNEKAETVPGSPLLN